jgi:hypothetical protein
MNDTLNDSREKEKKMKKKRANSEDEKRLLASTVSAPVHCRT